MYLQPGLGGDPTRQDSGGGRASVWGLQGTQPVPQSNRRQSCWPWSHWPFFSGPGLDSAQPCQQDTLFLLHWGSSRACRNRCPLSAQAWGWVSFLDASRKQRIWVEISWLPREACWHPHWLLSASIDWVSSSQHPLQMYKHLLAPAGSCFPLKRLDCVEPNLYMSSGLKS